MQSAAGTEKRKMLLLSLLVMLLWGSLFPMVKIGYRVFDVNTAKPADILMFAGVRFMVCGAIITGIALLRREKLHPDIKQSLLPVGIMGMFAIVLHYACTYIGLTLTDSSKTAILKQLGALFYICFSFLFVREEKFSVYKIAGAMAGFAGIIAINAGGNGGKFMLGDALIIGASVCTVISNLASKRAMKMNPAMITTGVSQLAGGVLLVVIAACMQGQIPVFTWRALPVFGYICFASITGYCLWFSIVKKHSLSKLFIIKFSEPVFACIFGALLLNENILRWQYALAFMLISAGIVLGHLSEREEIKK